MDEAGARCELFLYDGAGHGFFNNYKYDGKFYTLTVREMDQFLNSLKYLKGEPQL